MWTDGFQQTGADGRQHAGYSVWFGEWHALNQCAALPGLAQMNTRAEHMLEGWATERLRLITYRSRKRHGTL